MLPLLSKAKYERKFQGKDDRSPSMMDVDTEWGGGLNIISSFDSLSRGREHVDGIDQRRFGLNFFTPPRLS